MYFINIPFYVKKKHIMSAQQGFANIIPQRDDVCWRQLKNIIKSYVCAVTKHAVQRLNSFRNGVFEHVVDSFFVICILIMFVPETLQKCLKKDVCDVSWTQVTPQGLSKQTGLCYPHSMLSVIDIYQSDKYTPYCLPR